MSLDVTDPPVANTGGGGGPGGATAIDFLPPKFLSGASNPSNGYFDKDNWYGSTDADHAHFIVLQLTPASDDNSRWEYTIRVSPDGGFYTPGATDIGMWVGLRNGVQARYPFQLPKGWKFSVRESGPSAGEGSRNAFEQAVLVAA